MRTLLIALHVLLAVAVIAVLVRHLAGRAHEVGEVRAQWSVDHAETERMRAEMTQQKTLLAGLRSRDPYVIELLARERHSYSRPGEFALPQAPAVDKPSGAH